MRAARSHASVPVHRSRRTSRATDFRTAGRAEVAAEEASDGVRVVEETLQHGEVGVAVRGVGEVLRPRPGVSVREDHAPLGGTVPVTTPPGRLRGVRSAGGPVCRQSAAELCEGCSPKRSR
ncbi:hypothetical protein SALBM311S_10866 [Streptomyces alboniger]